MPSEPLPLTAGARGCVLCGQTFREADMIHIGGSWVCAACKPLFVQRMEEGVGPTAGFRDLSRLTAWLKGSLIAGVVVACLALASDCLLIGELRGGGEQVSGELMTSDIHQGAVGLIQFCVYVTTAVLFLRWIYFANSNARALGASGMRFSPGWSIGWYFIPVATLWKPYQAMKEIWQASADARNWLNVVVPTLLPAWWTLWLVSNFLGQASLRLSMRANDPEGLIAAAFVSLLSNAVDIPLGLVALRLVRTIWHGQKHQEAAGVVLAAA